MSVLIQTILVMTLIVLDFTAVSGDDGFESKKLTPDRDPKTLSKIVKATWCISSRSGPCYNEPHVVLRIIQSVTKLEYPKKI